MRREWYESFFSPLALEFWRAVVPPESTRDEVDFLERRARARRSGTTAGSALRRGSPRAGARPARAPGSPGSNLSPDAVERARAEARRTGSGAEFRVGGHAGAAGGAVRRRLLPRKQHRVPLARRSEGVPGGHAPVAPAGSEVGGGHGDGGRVAAAAVRGGGPDARGGGHPLHRPSAVRRRGGATASRRRRSSGARSARRGRSATGSTPWPSCDGSSARPGGIWSACTARWMGARSRLATRGC